LDLSQVKGIKMDGIWLDTLDFVIRNLDLWCCILLKFWMFFAAGFGGSWWQRWVGFAVLAVALNPFLE
jgi:hypothetical protein